MIRRAGATTTSHQLGSAMTNRRKVPVTKRVPTEDIEKKALDGLGRLLSPRGPEAPSQTEGGAGSGNTEGAGRESHKDQASGE